MSGVFFALCHLIMIASSALLPPFNVQLFSENFCHILTWEELNTNTSVIYYSVTYRTKQLMIPVNECTNITHRRCDLTDYFTNIKIYYKAYVHSFTQNAVSNVSSHRRIIYPIMETVLGPPIVSVVAGSELINITINPPVSHLKSADGKCTISMLNEIVYPLLIYTIKLVQSNLVSCNLFSILFLICRIYCKWFGGGKMPTQFFFFFNVYRTVLVFFYFLFCSGHSPLCQLEMRKRWLRTIFTIRNLLPITNYCVSVEVSASANMNPINIPSPIECVTTKHKPRTEDGNKFAIIISVTSVFVVLFTILLLIGLDFTGYLCIKKNTPDILMWLPRSEGTHNRNTELNDPKYVIPADLLSEVGNIECRIYHDNGRQNSDESISFLENGERNASGLCNNAPRPSTSSPAKPSAQECGPSAEEAMPTENEPLSEIPKSHCQKTLFPVKALYINSNRSQDKNEICNVNFKSVSLGDPELIWSSLKQELPPQISQNTITGLHDSRSPVVQKIRLFVNIFNLDVPPLEQSKDYSSKEKMTSGYSDFSDPEEDLTSDYIK
ncbi:uncharacterized protein LOC134612796 [Pelobates fuscus]|uniref:uncharacterized protein LOC134612796 n=1 Tax=Pelobates fuscus TaxID=191477 RepID=UPI002FE4C2A8